MRKQILRNLLLMVLVLTAKAFKVTAQDIQLVYDFPSSFSGSDIVEYNNHLIFQGKSSDKGLELWTSDGTTAGTSLLKDIFTGTSNGAPNFFKLAVGKVLFQSYNSNAYEFVLYATDGTSEGTIPLKTLCEGSLPFDVFLGTRNGVELNGKFYYAAKTTAEGTELFVTDGTADGTMLVKDINPGSNSSSPSEMAVLNNKIYFTASDGVAGKELWESDGTAAGTKLVKDIYPGSTGSSISFTIAYNNAIYFQADNGVNGKELWQSDGTEAGTVLLKDIYPGGGNYEGAPSHFVVFDDKLYFSANDASRRELWVTDGTADGTVLVKDINPGGVLSSNPGLNSGMLVANGKLFFAADVYNVTGRELRYYDPVLNDVLLVKDLNGTATNSSIFEMIAIDGKIIFSADSAGYGAEQVWITDGTAAGTKKIPYSGTVNSSPTILGFTILNNEVYFYSNYKGGSGTDLYKITTLVTGLQDHETRVSEVSCFPNPAFNELHIKSRLVFERYAITDLLGKPIVSGTVENNGIDIAFLNPGIYCIRLSDVTGTPVTATFIKK